MRKMDHNPFTGVTTYHDYDHTNDKTYIHEVQHDVEPLLKRNVRLANNPDYKKQGIKDEYYHFASVPLTVIHEWKVKYNLDAFKKEDLPKIEKLLKQREYRKLLTVNKI